MDTRSQQIFLSLIIPVMRNTLRIHAKELKISRKKVATEDEETVNGCDLGYSKKITYASDAAALNLRTKLLKENSKPLSVPWAGEHYIRKSSKAGKPVMTVFDEYSIPFYGILKKEYAQLLARLFLNTSGAMRKVQLSYAKTKTAQENLQHPVMDAVFFAAMHTKKMPPENFRRP